MLNQIKDPFSVVSHLAVAFFSVVALILLVILATLHASVWHVVSFSVSPLCLIQLCVPTTRQGIVTSNNWGRIG